jgi:hypothetical protein
MERRMTPPNITTTNPTTKDAFRLFARWLDDRHDAHVKLADEYHDEPTESAEQSSVASAFRNAANVAWEIAGGRPGETSRDTERFIKVSTTDLAALLGTLTNEPSPKAAEPEGWTGDVPFAIAEPTMEPCEFGEGLVERLARIAHDAGAASIGVEDRFDQMLDGTREMCRVEIRAILAELAKMPVELPDVNDVARIEWIAAYGTDDYTREKATDPDPTERGACFGEQRRQTMAGLGYVRGHLAPILAAKDARIALLEQDQEEKLVAARRYIAELEKQLANMTAERDQALVSIERADEDWRAKANEVDAALNRIIQLEKRLAENSLPIDAEGKTPGEVLRESLGAIVRAGNDVNARLEQAAQAVLRAFGPKYAREALERVREAIKNAPGEVDEYYSEFIDAEIAKCGTTVPTTPTPTSKPHGRIFLGVTFERELPDGTRERVDPQDIRFYAGDGLLPLVFVVNDSKSSPVD